MINENPNISEEIAFAKHASLRDLFANEELKIIQSEIAGYRLMRSTADKNLFSIFAVDSKDDLLACAAVDLTFEQASGIVAELNKQVESISE